MDETRPSLEESQMMRNRFARLLQGYSVHAQHSCPPQRPREARIREVMEGFATAIVKSDTLEKARAATDHGSIRSFMLGYRDAVERHRLQQEQTAIDFNLLAVMQLTGKEIRHSMVLAWLLDHDMRRMGSHAQGPLGFRLFLRELRLPQEYADCRYWVRREVAGDDSIVDIEIACRGRFLIHVENKIWSCEGADQTDREWGDLVRRAEALGIPFGKSAPLHALYLTPQGAKPANPNFRSISWGRIARVLEAFSEEAKPPDVKLFAAHYVRALRRFIVTTDKTEESHGEGIDERG